MLPHLEEEQVGSVRVTLTDVADFVDIPLSKRTGEFHLRTCSEAPEGE